MPRIRTIKPELWESPDVLPFDDGYQALWCWLISHADDAGRLHLDAAHIATVRRRPAKAIEKRLVLMEQRQMIARYQVDGRPYIALLNWDAHQRVDHPSQRVYPGPPDNPREHSGSLARTTGGSIDLPIDGPIRAHARPDEEKNQKDLPSGYPTNNLDLAETVDRIHERSRQLRGAG